MANYRIALSPELSEFIELIKKGRLFEVQKWLESGRPIPIPVEGKPSTSPLLVAVKTGFHSMVEVLVPAIGERDRINDLLHEAVHLNRPDLVDLLCRLGARPGSVPYHVASHGRDPSLLRFFEANGMDLEGGSPLAVALQNKNRAALGTYMRMRDAKPHLLRQVNMALRHHAQEGNLKWVSLLLWAGADPRAVVPWLEEKYADLEGTALEAAVSNGHCEIVMKFRLDPLRDDVSSLLRESSFAGSRELVELLLSVGATPGHGEERSALASYVHALGWALEGLIGSHRIRSITDALCLFASRGFVWTSYDRNSFGGLRRGLSKASCFEAIEVLNRLAKAGFFSEEVFRRLMSTPKMKELINLRYGNTLRLRELAGLEPATRR